MLRARPHAIHFKPILDFGEGQDSAQQIIAEASSGCLELTVTWSQ
jgi:hypothetical protein